MNFHDPILHGPFNRIGAGAFLLFLGSRLPQPPRADELARTSVGDRKLVPREEIARRVALASLPARATHYKHFADRNIVVKRHDQATAAAKKKPRSAETNFWSNAI